MDAFTQFVIYLIIRVFILTAMVISACGGLVALFSAIIELTSLDCCFIKSAKYTVVTVLATMAVLGLAYFMLLLDFTLQEATALKDIYSSTLPHS
jgi:hypothetical protein